MQDTRPAKVPLNPIVFFYVQKAYLYNISIRNAAEFSETLRNLENTLLNYWSYICDLLNWNKRTEIEKM